MIFSEDVWVRIAILVLGVCGFMVARHIRNHKTKQTPLVCMVGFDCHSVVHSDYSKIFGIPVEFAGMVYYACISLFYLLFIFLRDAMPAALILFLLVISSLAFIFSVYLIAVQIFILKKGCSWCIVSALISAGIFILTMFH